MGRLDWIVCVDSDWKENKSIFDCGQNFGASAEPPRPGQAIQRNDLFRNKPSVQMSLLLNLAPPKSDRNFQACLPRYKTNLKAGSRLTRSSQALPDPSSLGP